MARPRTSSPWALPAVEARTAAPLRAQTADLIRQSILTLDIAAGERLVERELIERLGVSRTTVREALRELESEGLVEVIPQRGAVVATVSEEDAVDLYEARGVIEGLVVRRFVERADDSQVAALQAAIEDYADAARQDLDIRDLLAVKDRFYEILGAGARSTTLWQLLSGLQGRVRVLRARSLSQPGRPEESANELRELGHAIAARDADRASGLCARHVQAAAETGLAALGSERGEAQVD
jgi:DNA-binding GntR family transcriptional regulator